jgi:hypothetical protein
MDLREALWTAVAEVFAFLLRRVAPLLYEPKAESGSCCYRSPKRASPAMKFHNLSVLKARQPIPSFFVSGEIAIRRREIAIITQISAFSSTKPTDFCRFPLIRRIFLQKSRIYACRFYILFFVFIHIVGSIFIFNIFFGLMASGTRSASN